MNPSGFYFTSTNVALQGGQGRSTAIALAPLSLATSQPLTADPNQIYLSPGTQPLMLEVDSSNALVVLTGSPFIFPAGFQSTIPLFGFRGTGITTLKLRTPAGFTQPSTATEVTVAVR